MNTSSGDIIFPIGKAIAAVTASVVAAGAIAWFVVSSWLPESTLEASVISMACVVWFATVVSLVPFRVVDGKAASQSILTMYLAGSALRLLFCLASVAVAVMAVKLDAKSTVVSLLIIYAPAMAVEIGFVRGYLRRLFARPLGETSEALA